MLSRNKSNIKQASFILIITMIFSKFMGLVRELVIANQFGTSQELDNFLLAYTIPTVITSMAMYAIPGIIIPRLSEIRVKEGEYEFWGASWYFMSVGLLIMLCITLTSFLTASQIIKLLAPTITEENFFNSVILLRILSIYLLFGGIFPILKGILHTKNIFLLPALAPLAIHVSLILSILFLSNELGNWSMVLGISVGAVLQVLVIFFYFMRRNIGMHFNLRNKYFINLHHSILTIILIEIIGQLYSVIDRHFASQVTGAIATLNYGRIVMMLPVSIFGLSISAAIFPSLGDYVAQRDLTKFKAIIKKSIILISVIGIPVTGVFVLFPNHIISLLLQRGAFDLDATIKTSEVLQYYSFGLLAIMIHTIYTKTYYSLGLEKVLLIVSTITVGLKIVLSYILFPTMLHTGLALSTSITFILSVIILSLYLKWYFQRKLLDQNN